MVQIGLSVPHICDTDKPLFDDVKHVPLCSLLDHLIACCQVSGAAKVWLRVG